MEGKEEEKKFWVGKRTQCSEAKNGSSRKKSTTTTTFNFCETPHVTFSSTRARGLEILFLASHIEILLVHITPIGHYESDVTFLWYPIYRMANALISFPNFLNKLGDLINWGKSGTSNIFKLAMMKHDLIQSRVFVKIG